MITRHMLARANLGVLQQFAMSHALVALDFDGTLAPIVDDPGAARMRAPTRELLVRLSQRYPTALISGRAVADVRKRVQGTGLQEIVGNHGLEPWLRAGELAKKSRAWLPVLERRLAGLAGVVIEDKTYSLAVHYRKSREKRRARAAIAAAVAELRGVRVIGGLMVVNLLPEGAPHKGIAVTAVRERLGCDTAIYVGDDETDEDVFGLDQPGRLLSIRVGHKRDSRAAYFLDSQRDVDALLEALVAFRAQRFGRAAGAR